METDAVARSEACPLGMQAAPSSISMSGTFFRKDLCHEKNSTAILLFRWFKKRCQLLAKECALSICKLPRRLVQEQCGYVNWPRPKWPKMCWRAVKTETKHAKIKFCVKLGMMPTQTNVKMTAVHMNYRVSRKLIFKWHERFREDRESLKNDSRSGWSVDRKWNNLTKSLTDACINKGTGNIRERKGRRMFSYSFECHQSKIVHIFADFVVLGVQKINL